VFYHKSTLGFAARSAAVIVFLAATLAIASVAEARTTNRSPIISGSPPVSVVAGQYYSFKPKASDPEGKALRFSIVNRPAWASFNFSTGRLFGTPGAKHVGQYIDIRIGVSDGRKRASLPAFAIDVRQAVTRYQVSLTVNGPGTVADSGNGISCNATCNYTFAAGRTLNLTQQPAAGAHFTTWSGSCSTAQQCSVSVAGPLNIAATFVADSPAPPPPPPPAPPPPPPGDVLGKLLNFAETWDRNWNFGGHTVTSAFDENYGKWDYTESTYEPWLFDRATVGYRLFELSGNTRWRDKFLSDFAYYRAHIDAQGIFTPKGEDDTKYGYVTPFVLYERLTGDQQYRPIAKRIYDSWVREWSPSFLPGPSAQLWTEREIAFALEAALGWFEITGDAAALNRAGAIVNQWTVASGSVGAPLVTYTQHEGGGPGGTTPQDLTNSPWMSALYFQAARRYYAITSNAEVLAQASKYADWCDSNCFYNAALAHPEFSGLVFPRYLTGALIGDAGYDEGNMGHCLDVGGLLKFALFAKQRRAESLTAIQARYAQMQACAERDFENWTRTTDYLPKYRVNPPRKFNWQLRGYYEDAH